MPDFKKLAIGFAIAAGVFAAPDFISTARAAEDFGAAGCVVKDGDYIVMGVNKIKPGFMEMTAEMLKNEFGDAHQGKLHDALHLPVGKKNPRFRGTAKEWAVRKAEDELGVSLKAVGDKPLWTEKMGSMWGSAYEGKEVVVWQCKFTDENEAAEARKKMSWDVPDTPFGAQYVDTRTMKDPSGKDVTTKWRYSEDQLRINKTLY